MTISEFVNRVAYQAHSELGMPTWGPAYEITAEHIEQIMRQGQWRTSTQQNFVMWCKCVRDAAVHMTREGQRPIGARLEMLSAKYYEGW